MKIRLGINYEGKNDIDAIKIFIKRIAEEVDIQIEFIDEKIIPSYTSILPRLKSNVGLLFLGGKIDLALLFTDQDKNEKQGRTEALGIVKGMSEFYFTHTVVGVADPHFEEWLIADVDTFKHVFKLDATKSIVGIKNPKICLNTYHTEWKKKDKPSLAETKVVLAQQSDLGAISRKSKTFKHFKQDLANTLKQLKDSN